MAEPTYEVKESTARELMKMLAWWRQQGRGGGGSPYGPARIPRPFDHRIRRFKVTTAGSPNEGNTLAKGYDGSDVYGEEVPVATPVSYAVGRELSAYEPDGGTGLTYGGNPIFWRDVEQAGLRYVTLSGTGTPPTYTATDVIAGGSYGSGKVPSYRPLGTTHLSGAATAGIGYVAADGTFTLLMAFEAYTTVLCEAP